MIADLFFDFVTWILDLIASLGSALPQPPQEVYDVVNQLCDFIEGGVAFVNCFFHLSFIQVCIPIWLTVTFMEQAYHIIMWVIKKIPFVSIE